MSQLTDPGVDALWKALFQTATPAGLGPDPRADRLDAAAVVGAVEGSERLARLSERDRSLVRALALLWHDHLDEAHEIAQEVSTADGSLLHGMMHRREPDFWNSKYWYRQAGWHPSHALLLKTVKEAFPPKDHDWVADLEKGGQWDAFAFVDLCEKAIKQRHKELAAQLARVQELEFRAVLQSLIEGR